MSKYLPGSSPMRPTTYGAMKSFTDQVARDFHDRADFAKRVWKRARRGRKPKSPANKSVTTKATMSNGSGQAFTMKKRQRRRKAEVTFKDLKRKVNQLSKKVSLKDCFHTLFEEGTFQVTSSSNRCAFNSSVICSPSSLETILNAVPRIDPAAVATVTTSDLTAAPNPSKWLLYFKRKFLFRNNYLYPVNVSCYVVKAKHYAGNSPSADVTNGLTTLTAPSGGVYSTTSVNFYPTHSKQFTDNWKILKSCKMRLQSGDEMVQYYNENIVYDQEINDLNTQAANDHYLRYILVRIEGTCCHDSVTTTNIGISPAALDCVITGSTVLKYEDIAPHKTVRATSGFSAITVGVVGVASAETETAL